MAENKLTTRPGVTLIEVMATIVIIAVAVIGAMGYRYHCALDARKADIQITAARLGLLLCEGWRGVEGSETYDPVDDLGSELVIEALEEGTGEPADSGLLGYYSIAAGGVSYRAALWWNGVSPRLRALTVLVTWRQGGSDDFNKSFRLVTYTSY